MSRICSGAPPLARVSEALLQMLELPDLEFSLYLPITYDYTIQQIRNCYNSLEQSLGGE